jgi:hypothetical protein
MYPDVWFPVRSQGVRMYVRSSCDHIFLYNGIKVSASIIRGWYITSLFIKKEHRSLTIIYEKTQQLYSPKMIDEKKSTKRPNFNSISELSLKLKERDFFVLYYSYSYICSMKSNGFEKRVNGPIVKKRNSTDLISHSYFLIESCRVLLQLRS